MRKKTTGSYERVCVCAAGVAFVAIGRAAPTFRSLRHQVCVHPSCYNRTGHNTPIETQCVSKALVELSDNPLPCWPGLCPATHDRHSAQGSTVLADSVLPVTTHLEGEASKRLLHTHGRRLTARQRCRSGASVRAANPDSYTYTRSAWCTRTHGTRLGQHKTCGATSDAPH
jgi:hypothetical protein